MLVSVFENFLVHNALYSSLQYDYEDLEDIHRFLQGYAPIEIYCPECNSLKVYHARKTKFDGPLPMPRPTENGVGVGHAYDVKSEKARIISDYEKKNKMLAIEYECTKSNGHKVTFILMLDKCCIQKIGQYPPFAEFDKAELLAYKKDLGEKNFSELKRASGLYSHGIGIGSFVYLRRIIERLVDEAYREALSNGAITEDEYRYEDGDKKHYRRMDGKISLLKGYLPDLLTEHSSLYGVVSKGIHELTEDECLQYYPILEKGITLILHERKTTRDRNAMKREYEQSLSQIKGEIQKP